MESVMTIGTEWPRASVDRSTRSLLLEVGRKWEATGGDAGECEDQGQKIHLVTDYTLALLKSPT